MTDAARHTFLELSSAVTGFSVAELQATGMQDTYYEVVARVFGTGLLGQLFSAWESIGENAELLEDQIEKVLVTDKKFGPMTKNIITLWYLGQWNQMPSDWRNAYGASAHDVTNIVSSAAYREGLVWPTIGAHPMGAKQPGFASWSAAPISNTSERHDGTSTS